MIQKQCGRDNVSEEFGRLLDEIHAMQGSSEMQEEICKKFNVELHIVDVACDTTDDKARNYDLAMIDSGKFSGDGNVVISKKTLMRMEKDTQFKNKVYASIEDLKNMGFLSGGMIKSTGAVIHEDGTAGYWIEFDWEEEDGEEKGILLNEQSIDLLIQKCRDIKDGITGKDLENILPIVAAGNKNPEKYREKMNRRIYK